MSVILDHSQAALAPVTVPNGSWPRAAFESGRVVFSITFVLASTDAHWSGDRAIFVASDSGGMWMSTRAFSLYNNTGGGTLVFGQAITWAAGQTVTFDVDSGLGRYTISGATTGNVTNQAFTPSGTRFTNGNALLVGRGGSGNSQWDSNATISDVDDGVVPGGDAAITLGSLTLASTSSIDVSGVATILLGGLTAFGEDVQGPITGAAAITLGALASSSIGAIDVAGAGAVTLGALTASGTGPSGMEVGSATVKQWMNANGAANTVVTTDPVSTTTGSVLVVWIARGNWSAAANPKGPTDSQGNTWTALPPGDQAYSAYPTSRSGVWYCVNTSGSAAHTFSMTRGPYNGGSTGDEVTLAMVELKGVAMVDSSTHVERAVGSANISGSAVTPSGPSITLALIGGNGPVGQTHTFTATAASATAGWQNIAAASANGNPDPNGYIQISPWVLLDEDGSGTGTAQNIGVAGTNNEGGSIFQAVFQMAAGVLASGTPTLSALTASGAGTFPVLGESAITLGSLAGAGAGSIDVSGIAAILLGGLTGSGTASADISGAGAITLGSLTSAGTNEASLFGEGAITLGALGAAGTDLPGITADGVAITLGGLTASGASFSALEGVGAITLGAVRAIGSAGESPPEVVSARVAVAVDGTTWFRATITEG